MSVQRWTLVGRLFMGAWVLFAVPSILGVLRYGVALASFAIVAGFLTWAVVWVWFWTRGLGHSRAAEVTGLVGNLAILATFSLIAPAPYGVGGVLVFVFIIAGVSFPIRQAAWLILGLSVLQVVTMAVRQEDPTTASGSLLNSVLVGGVGAGARLLWQSYRQLLAAREQLAYAAVSEERLRFARDVHDLLGQNLAVLVLKSELVAKQMPADADESLRQEMRDIANVARRSLNDVREAVAGYRQASLAAEVSNARSALRSAGIAFRVEDQVGHMADEQDAVLAWCLREAVTNVVKHSSAAKCEVSLAREHGMVTMQVADDGHGTTSLDGGSGLIGMRERVELVGGKVDVDSRHGKGLRLKVAVPAS